MIEYIFPVEYKAEIHWDEFMIQGWKKSKKQFLTFAFNRKFPHTLPDHEFWLYLYYTQNKSDEPIYQGKIRYKFHVIKWSAVEYEKSAAIYHLDSTLDAKVWFLCDHCTKVSLPTGKLLAIENFSHPQGKKLTSCMRNSISPAICLVEVTETPMV